MNRIVIATILGMLAHSALAQTYPSPIFNMLTLQTPLAQSSGGTGATSLPLATNAAKGVMEGDGTTISCANGVCTSIGGGGGCFTGGSNCFSTTNTGSSWRGAFEANETTWTPPTITNGQWSFYHSIILQSVGLTNRTSNVADQWNASLFGEYIEGYGSAALYNSHFVGEGIYTYIPAGLADGQNGGTFSGGLPGNPNYEEIGGLTAVGEMGSPGDYTENVASYICDNLGCGSGTGNQSRMTAFLAAVYKNYAGTDYGTSAFIADSLGTQQTTNAPNSIVRGLGGWLVGDDFSGVSNGGFVALEMRGGNAIADDLSGDVYVYAANDLVQSWNTTAATFSKPIVYATIPTGTAAYAACITSSGEIVSSTASADCFGGGSASVTSFNTRTGAVTLTSGDVSAVGGLVTGGSVSTALIGTLSLTNPLETNYGGIGYDAHLAPNGSLSIGNGTGFVNNTLTAGSGITITNGSGTITIAATGGGSGSLTVGTTSITSGSTGYLLYNNSGVLGNESVSSLTIGTGQLSGIVGTANGGLGYNASSAPDGSVPIGNGSGYINSTLSGGSGITITNGSGSITIATSATNPVATTFSATGTALTVNNASEFAGTIYTSSSGSTGTAISGSATDLSFYKGATLLADLNASSATFSVSPNTASGIIYYAQGTAGATCSGSPTASFATVGGIVTHC